MILKAHSLGYKFHIERFHNIFVALVIILRNIQQTSLTLNTNTSRQNSTPSSYSSLLIRQRNYLSLQVGKFFF